MLITLLACLVFSFCCSLVCVAINNVLAAEDMLLSGYGERLMLALPLWLCKMLFACLPCMATIWGGGGWLIFQTLAPLPEVAYFTGLLLTPAIIFMVSGFNILAEAFIVFIEFNEQDDECE